MVRSELITALADKFPEIDKVDVVGSVAIVLDAIADQVSNRGRVEIRGFGAFQLSHRPARKARNPKTGESVVVPAKPGLNFRAGKELKERVDC